MGAYFWVTVFVYMLQIEIRYNFLLVVMSEKENGGYEAALIHGLVWAGRWKAGLLPFPLSRPAGLNTSSNWTLGLIDPIWTSANLLSVWVCLWYMCRDIRDCVCVCLSASNIALYGFLALYY